MTIQKLNPRAFQLKLFLAVVLLVSCSSPQPAAIPTLPEPTALPAVAIQPTSAAATPAQTPALSETAAATAIPKLTQVPTHTLTMEGVKTVLRIHLKQGLVWSDGSPLTSKDIVGSYNVYWAQKSSIWGLIKNVVAQDATTVDFWLTNPSPRAERLILRSLQFGPYSVYGSWMDLFERFRLSGATPDSLDPKKVLDNLNQYKPETPVVYGPFILDAANYSESRVELLKNPTGFNAGKIDLDKVLVYYGNADDSIPLLLSDEIDYSVYAYTPEEIAQITAMQDMKMIYSPTGTGPGLWFNELVYPLGKKEVRQAFAYIIDRAATATAAMGPAGTAVQFEAGFTDTTVPAWLSPETVRQLNRYARDLSKAEELLKAAGCSKSTDGSWLDDQGKALAFELSVPDSSYPDWVAAAEEAARQLSDFGIKASVKTYPVADHAAIQKEGKYQILVDLSLYFNPPHPQSSFSYYLSAPRNKPGSPDGLVGMSFPITQTMDGKVYLLPDLLAAAGAGVDMAAQKSAVETLARIVNEQLPVLGLFERLTTDPLNTSARVTGWLPADDPLYLNGQASDNYIAIQFLNGTLKRSPTGDGSFHTIWTFLQPPNYDLNFFSTNSLVQNLGIPSTSLMYPPLFWYMYATGTYAPLVAESYEYVK